MNIQNHNSQYHSYHTTQYEDLSSQPFTILTQYLNMPISTSQDEGQYLEILPIIHSYKDDHKEKFIKRMKYVGVDDPK